MQFGHPKNAESIFTVNFYRTKHDSTDIKKQKKKTKKTFK